MSGETTRARNLCLDAAHMAALEEQASERDAAERLAATMIAWRWIYRPAPPASNLERPALLQVQAE